MNVGKLVSDYRFAIFLFTEHFGHFLSNIYVTACDDDDVCGGVL